MVKHHQGRLTRVYAFLTFALACLLTPSCRTSGEPTAVHTPSPISLSAHFKIEGDTLILDYEVTNKSNRDIYLLNRIYKTSPTWSIRPDIIYVELDASTGRIELSKKLADLPEGVSVNTPVAPFVTPLRSGLSFRERVQIPLPIREYRQYGMRSTSSGNDERQAFFNSLRFTLGYYWRPEGTKEDIRDIQDTQVVLPQVPHGQSVEFEQLTTPPFNLNVPGILPSTSSR